MKMLQSFVFVLLFSMFVSVSAQVPAISNISPNAASPGDLVIIDGANLDTVTAVEFAAWINGAAPLRQPIEAPMLTRTSTRIEVLCPLYGAFAPAGSPVPGVELGSVNVRAGMTYANAFDFHFYEATAGRYVTVGQGNLQSSGQGRPVVSWPTVLDPVIPINVQPISIFVQNAIPFTYAIAAISFAVPQPFPMFNGVPIVIDLPPLVIVDNLMVNAYGNCAMTILPISGGPWGLTLGVQWAVLDFAASNVALSNGLLVQI